MDFECDPIVVRLGSASPRHRHRVMTKAHRPHIEEIVIVSESVWASSPSTPLLSRHTACGALLLLLATAALAPAHAGSGSAPLPIRDFAGGVPTTPIVSGDIAYIGAGHSLSTWDIGDPSSPLLLHRVGVPSRGQIQGVARSGGYLYAAWSSANDDSGISVYSLVDPLAPVLVNEVDDYTASSLKILRAIAAGSDRLYLFDRENGVFVGSLADPEHPTFTRVLQSPAEFRSPTIIGQTLYTTVRNFLGNTAIQLFDITDPDVLVPLSGSLPYPGTTLFATAFAPPLAVATGEALTVFDLGTPGQVTEFAQVASAPASRVEVVGDHAWTFGFDGLDVWDLSTPSAPVAAGHLAVDLLGAEVGAGSGSRIITATRTDRLAILDGGQPAQPSLAGQANLPGGAESMDSALLGEHLILLQGGYGLSINARDTLQPLARFDADLPAQMNERAFEGLAVNGDRAALASWAYGVILVDLSDPLAPVELGRLPWPFASEIALGGSFAYVGRSTNGGVVQVVDVSAPGNPVARGVYTGATEVRAIALHGTHLFVADGLLGGLRILDIADPDQPVQVGFYDQGCEVLGNTAYDVAISDDGNTAYVACPSGLHIVDVGVPAAPVRLGLVTPTGDDWTIYRPRVAVRGDRAWLANAAGVHAFDIADPADPVALGSTVLGWSSPARLRALADGRVYASAVDSGLFVLGEGAPGDRLFANGFEPSP